MTVSPPSPPPPPYPRSSVPYIIALSLQRPPVSSQHLLRSLESLMWSYSFQSRSPFRIISKPQRPKFPGQTFLWEQKRTLPLMSFLTWLRVLGEENAAPSDGEWNHSFVQKCSRCPSRSCWEVWFQRAGGKPGPQSDCHMGRMLPGQGLITSQCTRGVIFLLDSWLMDK